MNDIAEYTKDNDLYTYIGGSVGCTAKKTTLILYVSALFSDILSTSSRLIYLHLQYLQVMHVVQLKQPYSLRLRQTHKSIALLHRFPTLQIVQNEKCEDWCERDYETLRIVDNSQGSNSILLDYKAVLLSVVK
jgi:hypothetical protein